MSKSRRQRRKARKLAKAAKRAAYLAYQAASDSFLSSYEWRTTRMKVLKRDGARCACCGATPADGVMMHVDHILPRKTYPSRALDMDNLQVLCELCNHGKGNWDNTDWRRKPAANEELEQANHIAAILKE